MSRRVVVLARSERALLFAAGLARQGTEVRTLLLDGAASLGPPALYLSAALRQQAESQLGPLAAAGTGLGESWWTPDGWAYKAHADPGEARALAWAERASNGDPEERDRCLLELSSGLSLHVLPEGVTGLRQRLVDDILNAGGEVLEEVAISEVDAEDGRVLGLWTGHGLEHVEETLWTDLAPSELIAGSVGATHAHFEAALWVEEPAALPAIGRLVRQGVAVHTVVRVGLLPEAEGRWSELRVQGSCRLDDARLARADDLARWLGATLSPLVGPVERAALVHVWPQAGKPQPSLEGLQRLPSHGGLLGLGRWVRWLSRLDGQPPPARTTRLRG